MHDFVALPPIYTYLLGLYLGDGSIASHARGVRKLRLSLDSRYPGIISECIAAIEAVVPGNKVNIIRRPTNDTEVYAYSKSWPCLFPQHGPGMKHTRPILLDSWQRSAIERSPELFLRGLIHSDGCRFINTGRAWSNPRYAFDNRSADIREIFEGTCAMLGLHTTRAKTTVYVSKKADVARMDGFIGPKA